MSVDQYLRVAADNVVRAVSELKTDIDRYRSDIELKKREMVERERDIHAQIQRDTKTTLRSNVESVQKALTIARVATLKHELDDMKHNMTNEINNMNKTLHALEGKVQDLQSKAGSLRNSSGV